MIRSFRSKALKRFFENDEAKGLPPQSLGKIATILDALDVATQVMELDVPSFKLHPLKGDRREFWSIWVTRNWRITFRFVDAPEGKTHDAKSALIEVLELAEINEPGAYEVNYEDYH